MVMDVLAAEVQPAPGLIYIMGSTDIDKNFDVQKCYMKFEHKGTSTNRSNTINKHISPANKANSGDPSPRDRRSKRIGNN